jgi:hypothetical protein
VASLTNPQKDELKEIATEVRNASLSTTGPRQRQLRVQAERLEKLAEDGQPAEDPDNPQG